MKTPEEFANECQKLYDNCHGETGKRGHINADDMIDNMLCELGYDKGVEILRSMIYYWYA